MNNHVSSFYIIGVFGSAEQLARGLKAALNQTGKKKTAYEHDALMGLPIAILSKLRFINLPKII